MLRIHSHFPSLVCKGLYYPSPTYPSYFSSCNSSLLLILLQPQWPLEILNVSKPFPPQDLLFSLTEALLLSPYTAGFLLFFKQMSFLKDPPEHTYHRVLYHRILFIFFIILIRVLIIIFHHDDLVWGGVCLFVSVCMACKILVSWPWMEPLPPAVETRNLKKWTAREVHHDYLFTVCLPY